MKSKGGTKGTEKKVLIREPCRESGWRKGLYEHKNYWGGGGHKVLVKGGNDRKEAKKDRNIKRAKDKSGSQKGEEKEHDYTSVEGQRRGEDWTRQVKKNI